MADRGGYAVQAPPNGPPGTKKVASTMMALSRNSWYDSRFSFGNTMSSQPSISGIRKFPNAAMSTGIATQKIMMLPCMVTSAL